ncbi:hypothetical protein ACFL6G_07580 [candidate division KSB1 bacterium]
MKRSVVVLFILLFLLPAVSYSAEDVKPIPKEKYLEFSRKAADWVWAKHDSLVSAWRKTLDPDNIFGYRSPGRLLEMASIYATLFELENNEEYAERAKHVLITYGDYKTEYPKEAEERRPDYVDGVPALPDFFTTMRYIRPYEILKKHGLLNSSQRQKIESVIAHSLNYLMQTQEWGAMNRTILRAETLAWAVRALPGHEKAKSWKINERALGFDNWGNWEIEDATIYHAVWLYSLLGYADAKGQMKEFFKLPEMYYYSQYFLHLMCPDMMIPDFGDAHWRSNWDRYLVFFEAAAKAYNDPELKWAASVIGNKFINFEQIRSTGLAYELLDCYRWGTDDLDPQPPKEMSEEVMEDVQGKKIVFRNGWEDKSTYMLLNYRDEGDGGQIFRDYLRDGIPVEEEKMTHGHADENSIPLLMYKGSVLLHDGGYRDYMPSGPYGAYRQDYFHNRLCIRPEKIWMGQKQGEYRYSPTDHPAVPGQSAIDFLHNAGSYKIIRTKKIDFLTFDDLDYSRTRLIDDNMGYEWDRVITYIKDPEMFVVFDVVKGIEEGFMTAVNLWHTREILNQGENWFDTRYDVMRNVQLNTDNHLLVYFPKTHYRIYQAEKASRHYQEEWAISETTGQYFELGQHIGFVTVLVPHASDQDPEYWLDRISFVDSKPEGAGMSVEINTGDGRVINVGMKRNMRMDMIRDYRRPKYTYEAGKMEFGKLETNADFFYTCKKEDKLSFTIVNLSRAFYDGQNIFDMKSGFYGLAFDGSSDQSGIGKARYWRDEVIIK